ncbi:MAG: bifunctional glutamate N-acetyltransferase/amino-acid acetyltransferase ArgJ [Ilumatobacteraceae bacterium]
MTDTQLPAGFTCHVANLGIKDDTTDFVVVLADRPSSTAGVFTTSRFAGPSVLVSRAHVADGAARAAVVISKNANVANGPDGRSDVEEVVARVASALGLATNDVLIASTGVIGRRYPMERVRSGLDALPATVTGTSADDVARAIMTTDTHPKVASATCGPATVVGVAKGVGMIEPDMATLITMFFTDAEVPAAALDPLFRRVIDRTFNCVSVDTDTSTSDTAWILANGAAGAVDLDAFEAALNDVATTLTKMVARDGEGATKLIEVTVTGARDRAQAKRVAKAIVNSPLVKTAVHGADPNWGRIAMAIGKCSDDVDIVESNVSIRFGGQEVFPRRVDDSGLDALAAYMRGDTVMIGADLGIADGSATVWGCDLSDGYVRINADYTT